MTIEYRSGDLFAGVEKSLEDGKRVVIAHVCNDEGGWGSGFVVPLGRTYPLAEAAYRKWHQDGSTSGTKSLICGSCHSTVVPFKLGECQIVQVVDFLPGLVIANMIGQRSTIQRAESKTPVRYAAIAKCLEKVAAYAKLAQSGHESHNKIEVHCPKFGAGLAGGRWTVVEALLDEIVGKVAPTIVYEMTEVEAIERNVLESVYQGFRE